MLGAIKFTSKLWPRLRATPISHDELLGSASDEPPVRSSGSRQTGLSWGSVGREHRSESKHSISTEASSVDRVNSVDFREHSLPLGQQSPERWRFFRNRLRSPGRSPRSELVERHFSMDHVALQGEMEKFIERIPHSRPSSRHPSEVSMSPPERKYSESEVESSDEEAPRPRVNRVNSSRATSVSLPVSKPREPRPSWYSRLCPRSHNEFKWLDEMPKRNEYTQPVPDDIFRGLAVSRMLCEGPGLMQNSQEEYTFALSEPVQAPHIDIFLSHTWNSDSLQKYLTMLYFFNGSFSLIAAHCAALTVFLMLLAIKVLTPYGNKLPAFFVPMPGNVEEYPFGLPVCGPCFFIGCVVQICTYLFGHVLFSFRGSYKQTVFLDKCCIHQTDEDLKLAGIKHVGGFVKQSRSMFVPFDDDYFERLWCTYEIAAFVRYQGSEVVNSLKFMPIKVAIFVFSIALAGFVGTTGFMFMVAVNDMVFKFWFEQNWFEYFAIWGTGGTLVFGVPKFIFCHLSLQSRRALHEKLKEFSVANAKVKFESDRQLIESSIVGWFGAVRVFDSIVQKVFPTIVRRSLGSHQQALRFWDVLQENAGVLFLFIYDASLMAFPDKGKVARCIAMGLSSHLVVDPLFLYSLNMLARLALRAPVGEHAKHSLRAVGVFTLGLVYPAWFAFCISSPLWQIGVATACLGVWVPFVFES